MPVNIKNNKKGGIKIMKGKEQIFKEWSLNWSDEKQEKKLTEIELLEDRLLELISEINKVFEINLDMDSVEHSELIISNRDNIISDLLEWKEMIK